jgi:pilus assembly protein Flp/PilA
LPLTTTRNTVQEKPMKVIKQMRRDETGATAIEYGLIAALIAVAAITAMQGLGTSLTSTFNTTASKLTPTGSST